MEAASCFWVKIGSLFRIDIPLFSESIQFDTKTTRMEPDDKVELREVFGLPYLSLG